MPEHDQSYLPPVNPICVPLPKPAEPPSQEASPESEEEWNEIEKLLPSNEELLRFARKHRAPQEWYDEPIDPR